MGVYKFVVFSNAQDGQAAEFEDWYVNTHIPDVLRIPGFVSGQQCRLTPVTTMLPQVGPTYMAVYEIETDDPQAVMDEMGARAGSPAMQISGALDPTSVMAMLAQPLEG